MSSQQSYHLTSSTSHGSAASSASPLHSIPENSASESTSTWYQSIVDFFSWSKSSVPSTQLARRNAPDASSSSPGDDGRAPFGVGALISSSGGSTEFSVLGLMLPAHLDDNFTDWSSIVAAMPDSCFPRYRMVLPKRTKILALDLDETLIHSTCRSSGDCDHFIEVLIDRSSCLYYLFKRPHLDQFLKTVSEWFHLVIYTASLREYADPVINWLDNGRGLFKKRLFRPACVEISPGVHAKNLCLIDGGDLSRVCLLDNTLASFNLHPLNGILIESWTHDRQDTALLDLLPFFDALRFVDDVRSILSLRVS